MTPATVIVLATAVLIGAAWLWLALAHLGLERRLNRHGRTLAQHQGAIVHLQTTVADTPLQVHAPMPTLGQLKPAAPDLHYPAPDESPVDPDATLRLGPPPSLARIDDACKAAGLMTVPREALARIAAIEQHLAGGRAATRMELARAIGVQPWEVAADLHSAVIARIVTTTTSHTAGEAAYRLCDPTIRMGSMPILWGAR